ncbi:MAG: glycosyltransferase [Deinococcales bacterium]
MNTPDTGAACRVLLVTTSMMTGGAETQVFLLARELRRRGHDVAIVSMREPEAYQTELAALGIPLVSLGMQRGVADPRAVLRLAGEVRRRQPDVVHSHMVHANLLTRLTRLLAPMPVQVSTAHNLTEGARWRDLAYRLTDPLCTLTTNVCPECVERFVAAGAVPRRKIRYLPNGLDVGAFARDERAGVEVRRALGAGAAFVWLAVGRLEAQKDYPTMLRAVAAVGGQSGGLVLWVAGGGPELAELERQRAALGLPAEQVRFLGHRGDIPALMAAADGYLMSSAWEGLPMVLLEAAVARLPLVATDVGGNREVVESGVDGLLVPPHRSEALAQAMQQVMAMPEDERTRWGWAGRSKVERVFAIERVVDRWEALYLELLERRRAVRAAAQG